MSKLFFRPNQANSTLFQVFLAVCSLCLDNVVISTDRGFVATESAIPALRDVIGFVDPSSPLVVDGDFERFDGAVANPELIVYVVTVRGEGVRYVKL